MKHLLVCLDLSEMDDHLVNYVRFFGEKMGIEKVSYVHVLKDWDLPESIEEMMDIPGGELDELIRNELNDKLKKPDAPVEMDEEIIVTHGYTITDAVRELAKKIKPDAIVLGNKNTYTGSGISGQRILENLDYPVLFLPETAHLAIRKVLLPLDFSRHSEKVVKLGLELADNFKAIKKGIHVLHLPEMFFPYIPEKVAIKEVEASARKHFRELMEKLDSKGELECDFVTTGKYGISKRIYNYAVQHQFNFIIIGAKGRNKLNLMNLGGVSQRLANLDLHIPLLILR